MGINLATLSARDTTVAFGDVFRQSSRWYPWNGDPSFGIRKQDQRAMRSMPRPELDEHGWAIVDDAPVFTRIFEVSDGRYPEGTYRARWRGTGTLTFTGDARAGKVREVRDEEGLHFEADVEVRPSKAGIVIVVERSEADDPLREIQLLAPDYDPADGPFRAQFLERLQPFEVLRFMNWAATYTNQGRWEDRARPSDARQTGRSGVALEFMLALCNQTDKDPWFCMPHLGDDEYVRNYAQAVRDGLEPGRKVYLEWSNENWNSIFPEAKWVNEQARSRGIQGAKVVAEETSRDFAIWDEVFAAPGPDGEALDIELVRVIGGALHNPGFARGVMGAMTTGYDAVAVAPYFGVRPGKDPVARNAGADELLEVAIANIDTHLIPRVVEHARLAQGASRRQGHPVRLLAYEGGQTLIARRSTTPGDARMAFNPKVIQEAQYSEAMIEGYQRLFEGCRDAGLDLFVAFHLCAPHTPASTFGVLEWIDQPLDQAPKYRALLQPWVK